MGVTTTNPDLMDILRKMLVRISNLETQFSRPIPSARINDLKLGGVGNADGILRLYDGSGNLIITLDNTGILVEDGNIVVKNSDGDTILDVLGLVSANNFPFSSVIGSGTQSVDFDDGIVNVSGLTVTFSLAREQQVLIMYSAQGNPNSGSSAFAPGAVFYLYVDGSLEDYGSVLTGVAYDSAIIGGNVTNHFITTLSAGSHTLQLKFECNPGAGSIDDFTCQRFATKITYFKMGS